MLSLLLLLSAALANDLCGSKTPPAGYRIAVGYATHMVRAKALEGARQAALDYAVKQYTAGWTPVQIASFNRQVFDWSDDNYQGGTACVRLAIADEAFTAEKDAADALTSRLRELASAVRQKTDTVEIAPPVWDSGCVADIGGALSTALLAEMVGVRFATGGPRLELRLAARADGVNVAPLLDGVALGGFTFPLSLFSVGEGEAGKCAGNAQLGMSADSRAGSSGLRVSVRLADSGGELCEGDKVGPLLSVSAPARVQLFSIERSGEGHFYGVFDVAGELSLPQGTAVPFPSGGDERLVAVAVPKGESFGKSDRWSDYCRLKTKFNARQFSEAAALGSTTFIVHAAGTSGCPDVPSSEVQTAAKAPDCP